MSEEQVVEQVDQSVAPMETPAEVAQGGSGNDFLNSIPEDLRADPSLSPIKDVENLARSYVNAQRLIGADKLPMPVNPTQEDLDNIYGRLGRPETPDGYTFEPDGNVLTEETAKAYADIAHQLRLTPEQASGVLDYYKNTAQAGMESAQQADAQTRERVENELKAEWGNNYESKLVSAKNVVDEFANPELLDMQLSDGTRIGNHPEFIKAFAKIADFRHSVTSEDTISDAPQSNIMTDKSAQAEIDSIMNDRSHAYWDRKNPNRQRAIDRVQELMSIVHG